MQSSAYLNIAALAVAIRAYVRASGLSISVLVARALKNPTAAPVTPSPFGLPGSNATIPLYHRVQFAHLMFKAWCNRGRLTTDGRREGPMTTRCVARCRVSAVTPRGGSGGYESRPDPCRPRACRLSRWLADGLP